MLMLIFMMMSLMLMIIMINSLFYKMIIKNYMFLMSMVLILLMNKMFNYNNIFFMFGMDSISMSLMILTVWVLSICIMASNKELNKSFKKIFMMIMIILTMILTVSFFSINLLLFFIFFELSLIPIMLLILGWGMQVNRIQATMYMIFYTLFGSLPLLIMIMVMYIKMNTLMLNMMLMFNFLPNSIMNMFWYMILISAFLIKMPMYFLHLWLPKAHVEAPISGSMILAGVMLKLGSYGIFRLMLIFPKLFINFNIFLMIISLMGSIYSSLICLSQSDMKIIVAYSSVVHMSILMSSMMTLMQWSFISSIMMMVAHGLCSSGMFCLVNMNYERSHSRSLLINKGMMMIIPSVSLWWFLLCTSNFSAPPSLNLFSEMMLFNSLIMWSNSIMPILFITSLLSTAYSIYLFAYTQYGKLFKNIFNFKMINSQDILILMLHWIPLNILFIQLNFMI